MKRSLIQAASLSSLLLLSTATAHAIPIGGVEFPDGVVSFADSVFSYTVGANVGTGYDDPSAALGVPDFIGGPNNTHFSLGIGGSLIVQFTDNSLTTSGNSDLDLWIFEVGTEVELFNVAISTDASSWIDLGDVLGQPTGIDIDSVAGVVAGGLYSFVRIKDILPNQSGAPFGEADIDAIGAISSGKAVDISLPGTVALVVLGLAGLGRTRRQKEICS